MQIKNNLKDLAKKVPGVFWLVGAIRYLKFRSDLRNANSQHGVGKNDFEPPPILRYRVHKALDDESYNKNGEAIASLVAERINSSFSRTKYIKVLDFACGPGRVAIRLKEKLSDILLYGSDIDNEAIDWATKNISHVAEFSINNSLPPTSFKDDFFDLIYSISLFTHLDEDMQFLWLKEMIRIVKPGGILLITVHGALCRSSCTAQELKHLDDSGFVFRIDHHGKIKLDGLPDFYQTTFHTKNYILNHWEQYAKVLEYVEGGVNGHQDLIVMKKSSGLAKDD